MPKPLLQHLGIPVHVTTTHAASTIIWDGLKPGVLTGTTDALELQMSPFPTV